MLQVQTSATLQAVELLPQNLILFDLGSTHALQVIANYDDGFSRNATDGATGIQYLVENTDILTVSDDGLLTAQGLGVTTVVAMLGDQQDSISVRVTVSCQTPSAFYSRLPFWRMDDTILSLVPFFDHCR